MACVLGQGLGETSFEFYLLGMEVGSLMAPHLESTLKGLKETFFMSSGPKPQKNPSVESESRKEQGQAWPFTRLPTMLISVQVQSLTPVFYFQCNSSSLFPTT